MSSFTKDSSMEDIAVWIEEKGHLSAEKAWELLKVFSLPRLSFKTFKNTFAKIQRILSSGSSDPGYSYLWRYCMHKAIERSNEIFSFVDPLDRAQLKRMIKTAEKMSDDEDRDLSIKSSGFMQWFWFIPNELGGGLLRQTPTSQPLLISILMNDHRDYFDELNQDDIRELAAEFYPTSVGAACALSLICAKEPNNENIQPLQMNRTILEAQFQRESPEFANASKRMEVDVRRRVEEIERVLFPDQASYEWGEDTHVFEEIDDIPWIALGRRFKSLEVHYRGIGTIMYERVSDELFNTITKDLSSASFLRVHRWKRTGGCVQDQGCCHDFAGSSVKISGTIMETGDTIPDPLPYHTAWQDAPCMFV